MVSEAFRSIDMLLAEIHGKTLQLLLDSEDYLTSTVFGHLRYLPPSLFWEKFLVRAFNSPLQGQPESLASDAAGSGCSISRYSNLRIQFWPSHPEYGEPDMLICLSGDNLRPLVILVEAKLWAEKSDSASGDQLVRYLSILDDLSRLNLLLPLNALRVMLYLTPRESIREVMESIGRSPEPSYAGQLIFRVQWQDIIVAATESIGDAHGQSRTILEDVIAFLKRRNLEYFSGYAKLAELLVLQRLNGAFLRSPNLFTTIALPENFVIEKGVWTGD